MTIQFYNSLSRRLEPLKPIEPGHVRMYTCGPTVHDFAHIGNFRTFLFEDILRKTLKFHGYRVTQVMNLTDVDDKTIRKSRGSNTPLQEYTATYKAAFFEDLDALRIERAEHYPEATAYIDAMVGMIDALRKRGHTYEAAGSTYFRLSSFPEYGMLSGAKHDHQTPNHHRIEHDEYEKDDVRDFALWKAWTEEDGDVYWDTLLGRGRPGWHIECSAMSRALLGDHFDIHTGGIDNRFPHHENEIAQNRCALGKRAANLWLHSEHLLVEGQKMSKSLGNFTTLRSLVERGFSPVVVRYALLSAHYRSRMNLTDDLLHASTQAVERLREFARRLTTLAEKDHDAPTKHQQIDGAERAFQSALFNDLNLPEALGHLFLFARAINALIDADQLASHDAAQILAWIKRVDTVLGVLDESPHQDRHAEIKALIEAREQARSARDWSRADQIRTQIEALGFAIKDTPQGTAWHKRLG